MATPPATALRSRPWSTRSPGPGNQASSPPEAGESVAEESASWKLLPSNTQVSVAARVGQDVSRGQFEQMTSVPVEGLPIAGTPGQIPQTEAIAGVATPGSGLAVTGQIGQAIIAVPQEIGQALVDCATGGTGQAGDSQLPSSGQAVC